MIKLLFAGTIFSSAFLLFLVQPIISKNILPWFGGSAAVWAICMVFFQVVLLAGYAYADWTSRNLKPRMQVVLHVLLLIISLATLPVLADASWKPKGDEDPTVWILLLLVATVGLPYFLLSTTGPLIQSWVMRTVVGARVYRYFSLSNLASLIALIAYPFLIEPYAALVTQSNTWSVVYGVFVALCAGSGLYLYLASGQSLTGKAADAEPASGVVPAKSDYLMWLGLSAMGSWMLVAITNHITQDIAAIPFLWLLPLTLYLFTFVLCFESDRWYSRRRFLLPGAVVMGLCAYGLQGSLPGGMQISIALYALGLFVMCMFVHGELASMRPAPKYLTRFYLMISLGGALGGVTVGLIAPRVLPAYYELGIGFVIIALLAMRVLRQRRAHVMASAGLAACCAYFLFAQVSYDFDGARRMERNFYGSLLTTDIARDDPDESTRRFYHGSVLHGEQYLAAQRKNEPTTYYGPTSGIGLAIQQRRPDVPQRIGLIGLGVGTLAVYGRPNDVYRFYEINPKVIDIAQSEFSFMRDSKARIETALGDARLLLEREKPNGFDVLAVDAFSGDSVPVHLLTREAMAIYAGHLSDSGIIAFHVTNRFLSLAPIVAQLAQDQGLFAALIHDEDPKLRDTDWVLVAKRSDVLLSPAIAQATRPIGPGRSPRVWTDDFNNLLQVMK